MNPIEVDVIIAKRLVRLAAWPVDANGASGWRATQLTRQSDGRFAPAPDARVIAEPTAADAIALLAAEVFARLLAVEATPRASTAPAPAAPAPDAVVPAPASLTREERAADLKATIDAAIERLAQQL